MKNPHHAEKGEQMKKWCRHIKIFGLPHHVCGQWYGMQRGANKEMVDVWPSWKLCPICGAERPSKKKGTK